MLRLAGVMFVGVAVFVATASASSSAPAIPWTKKAMTTAVRALGYPKPHPKKLACQGRGTTTTPGYFNSFRCIATYRHHHHRRVFSIAGRGEGGWLCAGAKLSRCHVLTRGFTATQTPGYPDAYAAAKGYVSNRYGIAYPNIGNEGQVGPLSWSFVTNTAPVVIVTITFRPAKGGYLITGSTS